MTPVVENKTLDETHAGDSVSIDRSLNRADLKLWASLTGNPNLDEHFIEARGVSTWATSLFFTLIGSKLPGIGSAIEGATTRYHRPVAIGEKVTATVTVKEVRRDTGSIVLDCLCIDASGVLVADAFIEVGAPKTKLRKEYAGHRLEELVDRCRGLPPMPTAVVHPCSADALMGAVEAVHHKLIAPIVVGPEDEFRKVAAAQKVDLANYRIVATADAEESAEKAAVMAVKGEAQARNIRP